MVKLVIVKVCFLLIFELFAPIRVQAQIWREIVPLKSKLEEVTKLQRGEQRLPDGSSYFDLQDYRNIIRHHSGGCSESEEKKFELLPDTVIEIKTIPKTELPKDILFSNFYSGRYEKTQPLSERNIYADFVSDLVAVTEMPKGKPELTNMIFYIPEVSEIPSCLLGKMDSLVRQVFENSKLTKQDKETYFYESIHIRYPELSSWNVKGLDYFSKTLKGSENSKGYIIVYAGKEARRNEASFWIKRLEQYLVKENKIDKKKLIFTDGGYRDTAIATLLIFPNEVGAPVPTPTVLPSKVKFIEEKKNSRIKRKNK